MIVALTFFVLASVLTVFSYHVLLKGFLDIEVREARFNLEGAITILNQELSALDATAQDYAYWNDMYEFVIKRDRAFIKSNLVSSTFSNLKVNFIVITDRNGNILYKQGFDLNKGEKVPIYRSFQGHKLFVPGLFFTEKEMVRPLRGIAKLPEGFALLSVKPILNSEGSGEPRGVFLAGRFLDDKEIRKLGEPLNLHLSLFHRDQPNAPPDIAAAWNDLSSADTTMVTPIDGTTIAGYGLIKDITGKHNLILKTKEKRPIFRQGIQTIIYILVFELFTACVFTLIMAVMLERLVLRRLLRISDEVKSIEADGDLSRRILLEGNDELTTLSREINNMLGKLEDSELRIRGEAEKYRAVIEDQTEFICRFDQEGILTFVNEAYYRFFRHNRKVMIGRHFLSFVPEEDRRRIRQLLETLTIDSPTTAYDMPVVFPDGREFWQHWTCRAIYNAEGKLSEYQAVGRDTTERKRVEDELSTLNRQLEEANAQLGQAYANMKNNLDKLRKHLFKEELAFLVDREGRIHGITERVLEQLKISRSQLIDANMIDLLPSEDRKTFGEVLRDAWIGITRQTFVKINNPQKDAEPQLFEIKMARLTLEGKRLLLITLR
ncbi:MAG: PAS domain S-box protein [Syntrophobacterales bacterium]|nr:PAS domain S-box protein [Syntrophobacterales bacterium]